jgi:hypothetical protein
MAKNLPPPPAPPPPRPRPQAILTVLSREWLAPHTVRVTAGGPGFGDGDQVSLSGYWAAGRSEDVFQSEKRQPIGQV